MSLWDTMENIRQVGKRNHKILKRKSYQSIMDKTMDDKLIYIPNDDEQN